MDDREVGRYWERNARVWTELARAGYDVYRDHLNTPWFLDMLPDLTGLHGLDIGCGEGHNTRLLARRCARVTAVDIAPTFVEHARAAERGAASSIDYRVASALALPFAAGSFDFATAFMSMMDVAEPDRAVAEAYRVIRPGGFFQFSITHPCYDTPHRRNLRDEHRQTYAIEVGRYFDTMDGELETWLFGAAPEEVKRGLPEFQIPRFRRTVSQWINLLLDTGFAIERLAEPTASDQAVARCPDLQDSQVVAFFLHVRARKP